MVEQTTIWGLHCEVLPRPLLEALRPSSELYQADKVEPHQHDFPAQHVEFGLGRRRAPLPNMREARLEIMKCHLFAHILVWQRTEFESGLRRDVVDEASRLAGPPVGGFPDPGGLIGRMRKADLVEGDFDTVLHA